MSSRLIGIVLFLLPMLLQSGCTPVLKGLIGIKNPKALEDKQIERYAKRYTIPAEASYKIDTAYQSFLLSQYSDTTKRAINNHFQPLQALYFDTSGYLKSFQVNCYAPGFPNLKWDRDSIMDVFPPRQQAPLDSLVSLEQMLSYLIPLSRTSQSITENHDYIVVVHWNRFMGRQGKRLIRTVKENARLAGTSTVKVLYVNTDIIYASGEMEKQ